jgi:hypothetical protein
MNYSPFYDPPIALETVWASVEEQLTRGMFSSRYDDLRKLVTAGLRFSTKIYMGVCPPSKPHQPVLGDC